MESSNWKEKWQGFWERRAQRKQEKQEKREEAEYNPGVFRLILRWIFRLRGIFISIPVATGAVLLAQDNMSKLPETLYMNLPKFTEDGAFIIEMTEIARNTAVYTPLAITGICLIFVLCSRRVVYPWLISIFSLILPVFVYVCTMLPG